MKESFAEVTGANALGPRDEVQDEKDFEEHLGVSIKMTTKITRELKAR